MNYRSSSQKGFSLIEMLIALVVSSVLIIGISTAYASIVGLVNTSKNLENAQEVLRYASVIFTRSLTNTSSGSVLASGSQLDVNQGANSIACDGSKPTYDYTEKFTVDSQNNLTCQLADQTSGAVNIAKVILTGVQSINFKKDNKQLVTVTVTPQALFGEPSNQGPTKSIQIDIALSEVIFVNATQTINTGP